MTPITTFAGQTVAVFGLGLSGLATCRALLAGGAEVLAADDGAKGREAAREAGLAVADLAAADWRKIHALVLAPGVPLTHPEPHWTVKAARAAGVEIIGDIELFCRERAKIAPSAPFVAITGTNGKSTTTALAAHILRSAGRDVAMGGNIGTAILALPPPSPERVHVIEMSSFQIELTPSLAPSVGVLLNITPDHLDRHGTMQNYAGLKERLVVAAAHPVIGEDDDWCRDIAERLRLSNRTWVDLISARSREPSGWYADGTSLVARAPWTGPLGTFADLSTAKALRGRHNIQNALAASAVALHMGVAPHAIAEGLASFPGLAHRLELIATQGRTLFVNDSKATNADSTENALAAFGDGIHWILGGKPKEGGIEPLTSYFPRVAKAYLIGQAAPAFAKTLEGRVPFEISGTLDVAVAHAALDAAASASAEPVVLLSPACASYDQFPNFEVRGDAFRTLVGALGGITLKPRGQAST